MNPRRALLRQSGIPGGKLALALAVDVTTVEFVRVRDVNERLFSREEFDEVFLLAVAAPTFPIAAKGPIDIATCSLSLVSISFRLARQSPTSHIRFS